MQLAAELLTGLLMVMQDNCNLHVILTTINPRGDGPYNEIIGAVNENLRAFGGSQAIKGLDFLDCATRFSSGPDSMPNLDLYERDEVTLNHKGVAEMGLCIEEVGAPQNQTEYDDLLLLSMSNFGFSSLSHCHSSLLAADASDAAAEGDGEPPGITASAPELLRRGKEDGSVCRCRRCHCGSGAPGRSPRDM